MDRMSDKPGRRNAISAPIWTTHPNLLGLCGLDFDLRANQGLRRMTRHGIILMLIPGKFHHQSRASRLGVAGRVKLVTEAALAVAAAHEELHIGSDSFWRAVHDQLKEQMPSEDSFHHKLNYASFNEFMTILAEARRRFTAQDKRPDDYEMKDMLASLDKWVEVQAKEKRSISTLFNQLEVNRPSGAISRKRKASDDAAAPFADRRHKRPNTTQTQEMDHQHTLPQESNGNNRQQISALKHDKPFFAEPDRRGFPTKSRHLEGEQRVLGTKSEMEPVLRPIADFRECTHIYLNNRVNELHAIVNKLRQDAVVLQQQKDETEARLVNLQGEWKGAIEMEHCRRKQVEDRLDQTEKTLQEVKNEYRTHREEAEQRLKEEYDARCKAESLVAELRKKVQAAENLHQAGKKLHASMHQKSQAEIMRLDQEVRNLRGKY